MMAENTLYYGDNLEILPRYIENESVDLVYLDPPFKSDQDYNILFAERNGSQAAAQIKAFEDTWDWDKISAPAYQEIVETGPARVSQAMEAFRTFLGENDMMAYLAMMAPRLVELQRVARNIGDFLLAFCDNSDNNTKIWRRESPTIDLANRRLMRYCVRHSQVN
jgi:site-specific DNA-methyltransferase (adenine-specific)